MSKRFILGAVVIVLAGIVLAAYLSREEKPASGQTLSKQELAEKYAEVAARLGQPSVPVQAVMVPLDLSQPVRLAIGGLGLADDDQNQQLGDLVTAELTGAPGFKLVERQSLAAILRELNLSLSGFVRAKDAVRAGKLLNADWFLLGTEAKINGTNALVVRVVDARTGILRDAGVFPCEKPTLELAADLASFMRQSRQNAALAKPRVYLAIGAFEDLSVNNRQADFPTQLRGYLTAAYQGGSVTLLEREYVETLLQEVHLDLAGLTEEGGTNPPAPMQSAFWLVSGQYQSYETTNFQVELDIDVQRIFGKARHFTLRGLPGEPVGRQIKAAIDEAMNQNSGAITPTRISEARIQMDIGKEVIHLDSTIGDIGLVFILQNGYWDPQQAARQKRNVEEAMRAFETVLLLEPTNRTAKMYLAACLRDSTIYRLDEARNCYREIIEEPVQDKWSGMAQQALCETFQAVSPDETIRWFESAAGQATNPVAAAIYNKQAEAVADGAKIANGDESKKVEAAEKAFFEYIRAFDGVMHGKGGTVASGMDDFVKVFGTNQTAAARRLVELLPQMISQAPDLQPYLLAEVVAFQVDTNAPVIAEFQKQFAQISEHPSQVLAVNYYWNLLGGQVYDWCMSHKLCDLAIKLMEGKIQAAADYPDHRIWGVNDDDKISLGYAYMGAQQWEKALTIFETYSNRSVQMDSEGPWGDMFSIMIPAREADYCRQKLGLSATRSSLEFSMGKPLMCLCTPYLTAYSAYSFNDPSTFIADDNGLWVGMGGQLLHLDFELRTNLIVNLPIDAFTPITALCLTSSNIWIATVGEGLIEFDKASRQCRHFTEEDGLMMDNITSLRLAGNTLWIGYGSGLLRQAGGLGKLDLTTGRFASFTPSLSGPENSDAERPTRFTVKAMAAGAAGDIWFLTDDNYIALCLRRYQSNNDLWKGFQNGCTAVDGDQRQMALAQCIAPVLSLLDYEDGQWRSLKAAADLPSGRVSTLTLDGNNLWVGGMGYIAVVDAVQDKLLHFAYVDAKTVNRIQIGGGYVWAQFDRHLYRAPLSALQ